MPLQTPTQVASSPGGHGIRPFGYTVEFAQNPEPNTFADPKSALWKQRLVVLQTVTLAYGAEGQTAQFSIWDPKAIDQTNFERPADWLREPKNGEAVRITIDDGKGMKKILFKGAIRSVRDVKEHSQVTWHAEAVSEVSRLNDVHITAIFNQDNDPLNPQPIFDGSGNVYAKKFTVREIIDQILLYKDPWGTEEYFRYDPDPARHCIDWGELGDSPRCGQFVPSQVVLDGPKGKAIADVLQRAGSNFTFIYDPNTDRIRIIELSRDCVSCGPKWDIHFPNTDAQAVDYGNAYASQYAIKSDSTIWTSSECANVCRVMSGPIRFYSGHYIVPEISSARNDAIDKRGDTAIAQTKRSHNPDLAHYRFTMPTETCVHDSRKERHYYVGAPLFPDWNIYEDWWPAMFEIGSVLVPPEWRASNWTPETPFQQPGTPSASVYDKMVEFQPHCLGDQIARGEVHLGFQDNLRAFQAWYAPEDCPACDGWGLVKAIYKNDKNENEPQIQLKPKGPDGAQRLMPEVTNYLMRPDYFGMVPKLPYTLPDGTAVSAANPFGLEPFCGTNPLGNPIVDWNDPVVQQTGGYPLPWKNTCPFCRGVGKWPIYKIRNINPNLYGGHNLQRPQNNPNASAEVPIDPDLTQIGPETWEEANNRIAMKSGPFLQMEVQVAAGKYVLPIWSKRDLPYTPEKDDPPNRETLSRLPGKYTEMAGSVSMERPYGRMDFPHPLQMRVNFKQIPLSGICVQKVGNAWSPTGVFNSPIIPPNWKCQVPTTTIQMGPAVQYTLDEHMGRVLFHQPVFIPCHKDFAAINTIKNGKVRLTPYGLAATSAPANGYRTVDDRGLPTGYWRPPRIWMTYTYSRERFFDNLAQDPHGKEVPEAEFRHTNLDGIEHEYLARAIIVDGRYGVEVRKKDGDQENSEQVQEISSKHRVIQRIISDEKTQIEVTESDFWLMPVPPKPLSDWPAPPQLPDTPATPTSPSIPGPPDPHQDPYMLYKWNLLKYQYVQGKILKWDRTTPNEKMVEASGWSDADHFGSWARPKIYTWLLRDDRPRLLDMAVRHLEYADNIQVKGSLHLVGTINVVNTGLGYVNYPRKAKAAVVRITYNFNDGFVTELELEREETRIGELPLAARELQNHVMRNLVALQRTLDVQRKFQANRFPAPQDAPMQQVGLGNQ